MHLYFHIPFCTSICPYCAFGSFDDKFSLVDDYFKALNHEVEIFLQTNDIKEIKTIFFGGGTPSSVNAKNYYKIFDKLNKHFANDIEITFESNPNSANQIWLNEVKSLGANRMSFGTQSFNEEKLKFLGRNHLSIDTFKAVQKAKKANFDNINVDIIYSTKLDNVELLKSEVENLKKLELSHISAYSLTLEKDTDFDGKFSFVKDDENLAKFLIGELENSGFSQYEISNFGKACKHNLAYWQGDEYFGFGSYSVGFHDKKRFYSPKNINNYIQNPLFKDIENLSSDDLRLEAIFLGARSIVGIKQNLLSQNEHKKAKFLEKEGKLSFKNGKFFNKNYLISDEIALYITE